MAFANPCAYMITNDEWNETYEERTAIMEHDGGVYKEHAESHARKEVDRRKWRYDKARGDTDVTECDNVSYYDRVGQVAARKFEIMAQNEHSSKGKR